MNYLEISKETISLIHKGRASLTSSSLDAEMRALVELRTSQVNHCDYCCIVHTNEAKRLSIPQEKIDAVEEWSNSPLFSEKEKAALRWTDAVTKLNGEEKLRFLDAYFSEKEIVDLTACIAIMNSLNRLNMTLRDYTKSSK